MHKQNIYTVYMIRLPTTSFYMLARFMQKLF